MASSLLFIFVFVVLACENASAATDVPFEENYETLWGYDHISLRNQNRELRMFLDQHSGAGFWSLRRYGSGFFRMRIKTPPKDTTNIVTTYYLNSTIDNIRDEIDFEFISKDRRPNILHTNLFINGRGGREQELVLWFDPSADFHDYALLFNQHQLVWFVDDTPIRVFKNKTSIGGSFPTQPAKVMATIWSSPNWPSPGKQPNWADAPFIADYQGFSIDGCVTQSTTSDPQCYSSNYWWNQEKYWQLDTIQQQKLLDVRKKYLIYDYCTRIPKSPECKS
ncbi:hypothetical protein L6164_005555 [Bauhinia variegata]|uniref:Uncharacterized protein n=1 Tax=Bauhinia variegata TaxID=167791 RepID=A0ACB9PQX0_BAUVA|nr:hypothetical protein L6164_005555 [Bauhinia variegata]